MVLKTGTRLGPYEIIATLGAGGMGEVYRATDTKLNRDVAIKVLPEDVAQDRDRLARFQREAHALASLNHPHIASIHGLEESDGVPCLVLELVEGQTLAERLKEGALPVEKALDLGRQMASALEAAHEKGIIHRDLKPANIMVTPEGSAKVLDFGLAKAFADESAEISGDVSLSPTLTAATRAGVILGTAAYMSPEQARGKRVDKRTDIWAFGCVLYEMLAGRQAFSGETASDAIAQILEREPDWDALPTTHPIVRGILRRCLRKDARQRFHDIGDVRVEMEEARDEPSELIEHTLAGRPSTTPVRRALPWVIAAAASVVALVALWMGRQGAPAARDVGRFTIDVPPDLTLRTTYLPSFALSRDGRTLVYVGHDGATSRLYRRSLDRDEAEPISGTEGAGYPFLSPDGDWIGFYGDGWLRKIATAGGAAIGLCEVGDDIPGVSWGPDGTIVLSHGWGEGLHEVSDSGGALRPVTVVDPASGEGAHMWPQLLPDGRTVLFTIWTIGKWEDARIAIVSLDTGERREIARGGTYARYLPSGHLVYARAGTLLAVPFDLGRLEVRGNEVPVLRDLMMSSEWGSAFHAISNAGTLVYLPGGERVQQAKVLRVDRRGTAEPLIDETIGPSWVDLSPDGRQLAVTMTGATYHIWIYDLENDNRRQLTFDGDTTQTRWTPDGNRLVFFANLGAGYDVMWKLADGTGGQEVLIPASDFGLGNLGSWSPDGAVLLLSRSNPGGAENLYELSLGPTPVLRPLLATEAAERSPRLSPDGRWLAYSSDSSGRAEIYVVAYPGMDRRTRISMGGGHQPFWRQDGRELFFHSGGSLYAVPVTTGDGFSAGEPAVLFDEIRVPGTVSRDPAVYELSAREAQFEVYYDVFPDGEHFVVVVDDPAAAPGKLRVVLNWFEELERLVPTE